MKLRHVALVGLLIPAVLFCQEFRGTITGVVSDPSGAAMPGAKVTVTEIHTGTKINSVADAAGQYSAPFLLPGDYEVAVQAQGFKSFLQKGIHVGAGDRPVIDVRLEVGDIATSVQVTADASQLNTENASVGQAITSKEVEELPINGRTPMMAASFAIGVIGYAQPTLVHPFDSGGAAGWVVGGAYQQTSELLINGSPDATWDGRLAFSPPQDAVQEVRIKVSDVDAAFGHTAGGTLNQITKSGTNALHGSGWEFNQPNTLTANDFFLNKAGSPRPVTHFNQYGVTAGGPIYIPHVLDTRNKLFWFFAWEGIKDAQPNPATLTVPTAAMRKGNFSGLATIYDPFSATLSGSTVNRTPLPNNTIPGTELNAIAHAYLTYYPLPTNSATINNYVTAPNTPDDYSNQMGRIDYNISDRNRLFADVRHSDYTQFKNDYFNNVAEGSLLFRNNLGIAIDDIHTLSATNVIDLRVNFTRMNEVHGSPSEGFNPTTLGFPSYLGGDSNYPQLPIVSFSSSTGLQALGATGASKLPSQSYQIFPTWQKTVGTHTLKAGGDIRQYRLNTFTAGNSTGSFSFSNNWVRSSSSASSTVAAGQDFASFLFGLPTSGQYDLNTYASWSSYYGAVFFQDDWRVRHNLTLNLGVRFDHDGPYNEKYGRTVTGFDTTDSNPLAGPAQIAYAKSPVAQLPATSFDVLGGLTFPGPNSSAVYRNHSHLVSPRVGVAYTPDALHGKTVIRASFGMFVAPVTLLAAGVDGKDSTSPDINQEGFSQTTSFVPTSNNYLSPLATLSNPYPNGFLQPTGNTLNLLTYAGQNITFLNPVAKSPYSLRWDLDVEHSITKDLMLEVAYIGNHSVHLPIDYTQLNGIPRQFLSTLPTQDPNEKFLTNSVANPFSGLNTTQNTATTSVAQLLAHYPEFPVGDSSSGWNGGSGIIEENLNDGRSYFDSLNVRLEKRTSHGLTFVFNYIYSRLMEQVMWLNDSDPVPEKRVSPDDHPQRYVFAMTYELPIGRGKALNVNSGWANAIVGGWIVNNVYTYQVGAPIIWNNGSSSSPGDYVYFGTAPLALNNRQVNGPAFDTNNFVTASANTFQYHIRTFPTTFSNLRADGINQYDPSISKRFMMSEKASLQIRVEAFNVLNHPVFAAPSTTATNSAFGDITASANRFRTIQLGARIVF